MEIVQLNQADPEGNSSPKRIFILSVIIIIIKELLSYTVRFTNFDQILGGTSSLSIAYDKRADVYKYYILDYMQYIPFKFDLLIIYGFDELYKLNFKLLFLTEIRVLSPLLRGNAESDVREGIESIINCIYIFHTFNYL